MESSPLTVGPLYSRAWGPWTHDIQIMWLVEKPKTVQVHFTLDVKGLRDQSKLNEWQYYMASYDDTKWFMFHGLFNIVLGPIKNMWV